MRDPKQTGPYAPETRIHALAQIEQYAKSLGEKYRALYEAASAPSGGSLGQARSGGGVSDPTGDAAVTPDALRKGAEDASKCISRALALLMRVEQIHHRLLEQHKGFDRPRKLWRVHTWTALPCGCSHDDTGYWSVSRSCAEHVAMVPEKHRVPWLETPLTRDTRHYGPFKPAAEGPAA